VSLIVGYNHKHLFTVLFILYIGTAYLFSISSPQAQIISLWPPAGVALAGCLLLGERFLPAVFLGSLCFSLGTNILSNEDANLPMIMSTAFIALGSTVQAWVNYKLLQYKKFNLLNNPSYSQISFFIVIAFLCCSVSTIIGNTAFHIASNGVSEALPLWDNVLVWWIGNFLGVILVTPLLLSIMGECKDGENGSTLIKGLGVPLILIVSIFQITQQYVEEKIIVETKNEFSLKAKVAENSLRQHMIIYLDALKQLEIELSQRNTINKFEFSQITEKLTDGLPGIKAMSWNPLVKQENALRFERDSQKYIDPNFTIRGSPLAPTDPLVVVQFIEPFDSNKAAQGFNVFSNEARKKSMLDSNASRIATATDTIQLVQSDKKEPGFLIFSPVFKSLHSNKDILGEFQSLSGFAVGVFLVPQIIKQSLSDELINFIDIFIYENADESSTVYGNRNILKSLSIGSGLSHIFDLSFANHLWTFNLNINEKMVLALQVKKSLYFLAAQALFGVLCVFIVLSIFGRNTGLRNLVKLRTQELEKVNAKLERYAFYDSLTELPNRRLFLDRAQHSLALAERNRTKIALLFLDLNEFKQVNDNWGHDFGDQLLKKVALQFSTILRDGDTLARIGGDEFILLMENNPNKEDIVAITQRLTACLIKPMEIDGELFTTSTSIGVSQFPKDGARVNDLIRAADAAMYEAKKKSTNIYFYSGVINTQSASL